LDETVANDWVSRQRLSSEKSDGHCESSKSHGGIRLIRGFPADAIQNVASILGIVRHPIVATIKLYDRIKNGLFASKSIVHSLPHLLNLEQF